MATITTNTAENITIENLKAKLDLKDHAYGSNHSATAELGKWTINTSQSIELDRSFYSKSWHRRYGAKVTVSDRCVTFKKPHGRGFITKTVDLNSWSGNWLENAIVSAGLAPKTKTPLSVRLHKAFDATHVKTLRGHKIYQRTLLGIAVDWVIVAPMGTTYHCDQYSGLIRGLYTKIRAAAKVRFTENVIDWNACRSLGFCKEGIQAFCDDFGFDVRKQYSVDQVAAAVRADNHKAIPYLAELRTLAAAYNYTI